MPDRTTDSDPASDSRIARLEARMADLEALLTRVLGSQALAPSSDQFAKTQKLTALDLRTDPAPPARESSGLGITAAFATLDSRVAAAAEFESSLARKPDLSEVVPIDASLIEDAFAIRERPRPARRPRSGPVRSAVEALHPGLLKRITLIWRSPECHDYLKRLIVDERGDRSGFPPEVMSELLFLNEILEVSASADAWAANARAD